LLLVLQPAGLLSVFTTIFVACANVFMSAPRMAMTAATLLSVLLFVAAFLATLVCWLVFPEFCVDEVREAVLCIDLASGVLHIPMFLQSGPSTSMQLLESSTAGRASMG
jgi:hypothetical protein